MFMLRVIAVGAVVVWSTPGASIIPGDARRGEQLFHSEQCIQCHSLKGKGGTLAPDLSRRVGRDYTPSVMASLMWNHAPDMWTAMKRQGVTKGNMTCLLYTSDAADDLTRVDLGGRRIIKKKK